MKHGMMLKSNHEQIWTLTPVTLANDLAARNSLRLRRVYSDIDSWLVALGNKNITHCDIRPTNVVFFENTMEPLVATFANLTVSKSSSSPAAVSSSSQGLDLKHNPEGCWCLIDFGMARVDNEKLTLSWSGQTAACLYMPWNVHPANAQRQIPDANQLVELAYPVSADREMFFNSCISFACGNGGLWFGSFK